MATAIPRDLDIYVTANTDALIRAARIVAKHLTAMADELEQAKAEAQEAER